MMVAYVGRLGIQPIGTLETTAAVLGEVLGGLTFEEDTRRIFDEYPAFIADTPDLRYALLGNPDPDDDVRANPTADFELYVSSQRHLMVGETEDISERLLNSLKRDARVSCWLLG